MEPSGWTPSCSADSGRDLPGPFRSISSIPRKKTKVAGGSEIVERSRQTGKARAEMPRGRWGLGGPEGTLASRRGGPDFWAQMSPDLGAPEVPATMPSGSSMKGPGNGHVIRGPVAGPQGPLPAYFSKSRAPGFVPVQVTTWPGEGLGG